jgi:hypothetical protein
MLAKRTLSVKCETFPEFWKYTEYGICISAAHDLISRDQCSHSNFRLSSCVFRVKLLETMMMLASGSFLARLSVACRPRFGAA